MLQCRRVLTLALLLGLAVSVPTGLFGCGKKVSGPPRASVSGKVTLGGKAVEGIEVHFFNEEYPDYGAYGVTDASGNFRLVQGAVVGKNKVYFSKTEGTAPVTLDPESGMDAGQLEAMQIGNEKSVAVKELGIKELVPAQYTGANSKLTFQVPPEGADSANFDL